VLSREKKRVFECDESVCNREIMCVFGRKKKSVFVCDEKERVFVKRESVSVLCV